MPVFTCCLSGKNTDGPQQWERNHATGPWGLAGKVTVGICAAKRAVVQDETKSDRP